MEEINTLVAYSNAMSPKRSDDGIEVCLQLRQVKQIEFNKMHYFENRLKNPDLFDSKADKYDNECSIFNYVI